MPRNFGPLALCRSARTAPDWAKQTRRGMNPYSFEWKDAATRGNNNYFVNLTTQPILPTAAAGNKFTVSMWIKPTTTTDIGLWEITDGSGNDLIAWTLDASSKVMVRFGGIGYVSPFNLTANTWNYLLFAHNGADWDLWVNNSLWSYGHSTDPDLSSTLRFNIGSALSASGSPSLFYEGWVDDIAVWSDWVPTSGEAGTLYGGGAAWNLSLSDNPAPDNMTAWWDGRDTGTTTYLNLASFTGTMRVDNAVQEWTGLGATRPSRSLVRPEPKSNDYSRLATLWGSWAGGATIDGKTALGASVSLESVAPALLPYPRAGWGVSAPVGSYVGLIVQPQQTPQLTASGNLVATGQATTPQVGTGTMQYALDSRQIRMLRPNFVSVL